MVITEKENIDFKAILVLLLGIISFNFFVSDKLPQSFTDKYFPVA